MRDNHDSTGTSGSGFLARQHNKLRFTELCETFFARLILSKCPDPDETNVIHIQLSLCDLFRRFAPDELVVKLEGEMVCEAPKIMEIASDVLSGLLGDKLSADTTTQPALEYYQNHIETRLKWLKSGDTGEQRPACIIDFTKSISGALTSFDITVRPAHLRELLGAQITADLEASAKLIQQINSLPQRPVDPGPRIDYCKQVEFLVEYLDQRQAMTGETSFSFLSSHIPFRWMLMHMDRLNVTMPGIGTTDAETKILLPLFLEANGYLDVIDLDLESDPLLPHDVVVRYSVRRPAKHNIFSANNAGLASTIRAQLNEMELTLYHRLHEKIREDLVFGGRPKLECSFGTIGAWLIRKTTYCLEEPTFLGQPARHWLKEHEGDKTLLMEDRFFLPFIYEKLRNDFGPRVVKKPERFGGEIDLLFDDVIPIELKVRRGRQKPLVISDVDESFRPGGQAAAYAAISRLGFVVVLDLPNKDTQAVSLDNCVTVIERRFPDTAEYPTCVVLIVFRCYERTPSAER